MYSHDWNAMLCFGMFLSYQMVTYVNGLIETHVVSRADLAADYSAKGHSKCSSIFTSFLSSWPYAVLGLIFLGFRPRVVFFNFPIPSFRFGFDACGEALLIVHIRRALTLSCSILFCSVCMQAAPFASCTRLSSGTSNTS